MAAANSSRAETAPGNERIRDISFVGCDINEHLAGILGPGFVDYRKRWASAEQLLQTPDAPLFLQVETINGCNLRCRMCFRRTKAGSPVKTMRPELFQRIIEQVAEERIPSMCLNENNEPLLDREIPNRIAMARAAGVIDARINTNGMLLTAEMSRRLIASGLTRLSVSIDAARVETYSGIRTGGDFHRVVTNVLNFLDLRRAAGARLPVLRVTFVVLEENTSEQDEFVAFWADKADYVSFQRYVPHTSADVAKGLGAKSASNGGGVCSQPFERLIIDVDGGVYPCCSPLGRNLRLGSIQEQSIHELWNSAREKHLRQCMSAGDLQSEAVCAACRGG